MSVRRAAGAPFRFLVLGGLLFVAQRWAAVEPGPGPACGAPPPAPAATDEQLLYRAALARGLAADDVVVRRRLADKMRFVGAASDADEDELYRDALALDLDVGDVVVERRLAQRMRALVEGSAEAGEPTEAELTAHLARHGETLALPDRVRLTQVVLASGRRGARAAADARALRARLERDAIGAGAAAARGDPLPLPTHLPLASERELAALFGPALAAAALALPAGQWSAPVRSAYGYHLLWVHEHVAGGPPPLGDVRETLRQAIRQAHAGRALDAALAAWRAGTAER